jgi:hypothetical protein
MIARIFIQIAQGAGAVLDFVIKNIIWIKALAAAIITVKVAIGLMTFAMKIYDLSTKVATISTKALKYALITTGIGAIIVAVATLAGTLLEYADATEAAKAGTDDMFSELDLMSPEMKMAIQAYKDAIIEIDTVNNLVFADGILVFDQAKFDEAARAVSDAADNLKNALKNKIKGIKETAEKFRDSVGLAFGVFGKDENSVFNVDVVINKMKHYNKLDEAFADKLVAWADIIRKTFQEGGVDEIISTRRLVNIVQAYSIFNDQVESIQYCINRFDDDTKLAFMDLYAKMYSPEEVMKVAEPEKKYSVTVDEIPF